MEDVINVNIYIFINKTILFYEKNNPNKVIFIFLKLDNIRKQNEKVRK
jgi:hypothetical protein